MSKVVLVLNDVVYSYKMKTGNNVNVIRHASCVFETGKTYAIQSEKGTGKTTLLKIMAGLDKVDSGAILFNDKNINEMDSYEYRNKMVGCALLGMDLISHYTAKENVLLQLDISAVDKPEERKKRAEELLEFVGLKPEECNRKICKMNDAQLQRVRLARALATSGDVILYDDVNMGLSKEETEALKEIIRLTAKDKQKCVIFTTESPNIASDADGIYTINRGTVIKVK